MISNWGKRLSTVFRSRIFRGYGFPVVVSLLLHASLLVIMTTSWSVQRELNIVPPRNIKASLVEVAQSPSAQPAPRPQVDDAARRERERQAAERKRQEQARRQEQKRQREIALRKEREAKEKARREEEARKQRERQAGLERQRKLEQERRRQQQKEETLRRLERERLQRQQQEAAAQAAREQVQKDEAEVAYYSGLLSNLIINNWNRPPSARNNMTALLQVTLSPFGDLLEVKLLDSSGSEAFDRSAVRAVQSAAPFPELKKLDRRIFDASFRRFNFRFRPEDLVR